MAPDPQPPAPRSRRRRNRRVTALPEIELGFPPPDVGQLPPGTLEAPHLGSPTPAPPPAAPPIDPEPPRRNRRPFPWGPLLGGLALAGGLAASWALLPVRQVTVSGNRHLTGAEVRRLAGLGGVPGGGEFGWLYYGGWRARGLLDSPWVAAAQVTRRFPDRVEITVTERVPVARWQDVTGTLESLAADGTVLPGVAQAGALPLVHGWGPERREEALRVLSALSGYNVQSVAYTPSGLRVNLAAGSVWSGDPESLLKYAGSIGMYPNKNINIYPWGVSVQE